MTTALLDPADQVPRHQEGRHAKLSTMTKRYEGRLFQNLRDESSTFEDLELVNCDFDAIMLSASADPETFTTIRNCTFTNSRVSAAVFPEHSLLEDVTVDGMQVRSQLELNGARLRHVVLEGTIGELRLNVAHGLPGPDSAERCRRINHTAKEWYDGLDWALDVRRARFTELPEVVNVPGRLVRHDPATAAVITAERARSIDYRSIDFEGGPIIPMVAKMLHHGVDSCIAIAPSKGQMKRPMLRAIEIAREVGLVEPALANAPCRSDSTGGRSA